MGKKNFEKDLRDAGVRKKRARKVAKAAERGRSGDRTARKLVEEQAAALRDSISAVVRHAKPPRSKSAPKASAKKRSAAKRRPRRIHREAIRSEDVGRPEAIGGEAIGRQATGPQASDQEHLEEAGIGTAIGLQVDGAQDVVKIGRPPLGSCGVDLTVDFKPLTSSPFDLESP